MNTNSFTILRFFLILVAVILFGVDAIAQPPTPPRVKIQSVALAIFALAFLPLP